MRLQCSNLDFSLSIRLTSTLTMTLKYLLLIVQNYPLDYFSWSRCFATTWWRTPISGAGSRPRRGPSARPTSSTPTFCSSSAFLKLYFTRFGFLIVELRLRGNGCDTRSRAGVRFPVSSNKILCFCSFLLWGGRKIIDGRLVLCFLVFPLTGAIEIFTNKSTYKKFAKVLLALDLSLPNHSSSVYKFKAVFRASRLKKNMQKDI